MVPTVAAYTRANELRTPTVVMIRGTAFYFEVI